MDQEKGAVKILKDFSHPGHNLFQLLPASRDYNITAIQDHQTQVQLLSTCHHPHK